MSRVYLVVTVLAALRSVSSLLAGQAPAVSEAHPRPTMAIENTANVDVVNGCVTGARTVLINDGVVTAIGDTGGVEIPSNAVRVDATGRYVMPGLVDMHVHLFNNDSRRAPNEWTFPLFIANGVTGVREMSCTPGEMQTVQGWRGTTDRGDLIAPHILAAGVAVQGTLPRSRAEKSSRHTVQVPTSSKSSQV
ncbi:MAG: hypothetical protein ABR526_01265 [Chthoniobacterales bacterium]